MRCGAEARAGPVRSVLQTRPCHYLIVRPRLSCLLGFVSGVWSDLGLCDHACTQALAMPAACPTHEDDEDAAPPQKPVPPAAEGTADKVAESPAPAPPRPKAVPQGPAGVAEQRAAMQAAHQRQMEERRKQQQEHQREVQRQREQGETHGRLSGFGSPPPTPVGDREL